MFAAHAGAGRRSGVVSGVCECVGDITAKSWGASQKDEARAKASQEVNAA